MFNKSVNLAFCCAFLCSCTVQGHQSSTRLSRPGIESPAIASNKAAAGTQNSAKKLESYSVEIIQKGKQDPASVTARAWTRSLVNGSLDTPDHVTTSFSEEGTILWGYCRNGFMVANCRSENGSVLADQTFGCGLVLNQERNVAMFDCSVDVR